MVAQPYPWVLETASARALRLRKVEIDEERRARLLKRVETLEEREARLRKNLVCSRWKREETLFKQVHELAMDFECEVYLIVQHHGEKDRQVYHSQPEKKEWVTDYRTLLEECWPPIVENNRKTMGPTKKQLARLAEESQSQPQVVNMDQTRGSMDRSGEQIPLPSAPETPLPQGTARPSGASHAATASSSLKRRRQDVGDGVDEDDSNKQAGTDVHDPVLRMGKTSVHDDSHPSTRTARVARVNSAIDGAITPEANVGVNRGSTSRPPPAKPTCESLDFPSTPRAAPPKRGAVLAQSLARSLQVVVHDVSTPTQGCQSHLRQHNPRGLAPSLLQRNPTPTPKKASDDETYEHRRFAVDLEAPENPQELRRERSGSFEPSIPRPRLQKATRRVPKRPRRLKIY